MLQNDFLESDIINGIVIRLELRVMCMQQPSHVEEHPCAEPAIRKGVLRGYEVLGLVGAEQPVRGNQLHQRTHVLEVHVFF